MDRQPRPDRNTCPGEHRSADRARGLFVVVRRATLEAIVESLTIAYENAVAAADDDVIDFEPFDGLPEAIDTLRTVLAGGPSA